MRILVTGRGGQVATSIEERAPEGHELLFVDRPEFDLADPASIARVVEEFRPDIVLSTAAYTAVDKAEDEPELATAVNATGPSALAEAARRAGAPIIHLSTDYVFDGTLDRPYREDDATGPIGVYGKTKLAGEEAVRAAGGDHAILRTAWVYSPFGANFVKTMLRFGAEREELTVVADQIGGPTSALDIADALFAMIATWQAKGEWPGGTYHFTGAGEASWADFARAIFAESAILGGPNARIRDIATHDWPTKAVRPANSRLDCSYFSATFGFRAPAWPDSLRTVVRRLLTT